MSRDGYSTRIRGAYATNYDDWSNSSRTYKLLDNQCGGIMKIPEGKICAFVVTEPDAEFSIYIFDQDSNIFRINNQDRTAGWRSNMGPVHIN